MSKIGSKIYFSKGDDEPFRMVKQFFFSCFGPWKISKCLNLGCSRDQKWVKNGSKTRFSKVILNYAACSNSCLLPILSPW